MDDSEFEERADCCSDYDGMDEERDSDPAALRRQRERARALAEFPIRTRYNPKDRSHLRAEASEDTAPRASQRSSIRSSRRSSSASAVPATQTERFVRLARAAADRGRVEAEVLKDAAKAAASTSAQTLSGQGADKVLADLTSMLNPLPPEEDFEAYGVSSATVRTELQRRSLNRIMEEQRAETLRSPWLEMHDHGQYYCGVENNAAKSEKLLNAMARASAEELERQVEDAHKLQAGGGKERFGSQTLQKARLETKDLEDLWCLLPGGSAMRRLPEAHECVYDFGEGRVSMPRYFADDAHESERQVTAGQLLEVRTRMKRNGQGGKLTLTTRLPRRACMKGPSTLEEICDVEALDREAALEAANHEANEQKRLKCMKGKAYNHLTVPKKPPSAKLWAQWRELQAERQLAAARELEARRRATGQTADDDASPLEYDEPETVLATPSPRSPLSPFSPTSPTQFAMDGMPLSPAGRASPTGRGRRQQIMGAPAQLGLEDVPWDARPPPNPEEMEGLLDVLLPKQVAESTRRRSQLLRDIDPDAFAEQRELFWTVTAVGDTDFELKIAVDVTGLKQPAALDDPSLEPAHEDEDFWRGVFEPVGSGAARQGCLSACSC